MKVIIVAEKPAISQAIAPFARKHWPDADIGFVHISFHHLKFRYPHTLRWADFPHVSEPQNAVAALGGWKSPFIRLTAEGIRVLPEIAPAADLRRADLVVCACDPDHTGAISFEVAVDYLRGAGEAAACPTLKIATWDNDAIEAAFAAIAPFSAAHGARLEYGRTKRYFDWNWNVNSLSVLGEAQRRAGVYSNPKTGGAPLLSKYALQLLFGLQGRPPMSEGDTMLLMQKWPGTGRYHALQGDWLQQLGSPASRAPILDNLFYAGLLERVSTPGQQGIQVSERGRALLELLHPDCEDLDLPFRLHAWCEQGASAKPAIDRYIKTFFGKQLRYPGIAAAST